MNIVNPRRILTMMITLGWAVFLSGPVGAATGRAAPADPTVGGATLWQTLVAGGSVMIVIGLLSVVAVALVIYDLMTLHVNKLTPRVFFESVMRKLQNREYKEVKALCEKEKNNIIAKIVLAGLERGEKSLRDPLVKDAMEHRTRIEIGNLWQNLNYLSDIVAVAPLLGLLGTVLGMIEAFRAVPLQAVGAKTALLSAGISKAMVTTASGLFIAIPVLMAYSYFRGKVLEITNDIEIYSADLIKVMDKN